MKIEITDNFRKKFRRQIHYISLDKPQSAKKINKLVFQEIRKLAEMPFKKRKSIFFDDENIRDLIVKGYIIVYEIIPSEDRIVVFAFYKWEDGLKD